MVILAELAGANLLGTSTARSKVARMPSISIVRNANRRPADPKKRPLVLLLGNSHTYALPGLNPGDPLRPDSGGILIDELAARIGAEHGRRDPVFVAMTCPNFLPFEMLTRVGDLLVHGYQPRIVVLGLTWRNVARDSELRKDVADLYQDQAFVAAFEKLLSESGVDAPPDVMTAVDKAGEVGKKEHEKAGSISPAEQWNEKLTDLAEERVTLLGKSAELRGYIGRLLLTRVQSLSRDRDMAYVYDLVEGDYAFNRKCLETLLRLLKQQGAEVICYYAPQRSDQPLMMDPEQQLEFMTWLESLSGPLGITVFDARAVVPNEYWGWAGDQPDQSHFTEPGHQKLAEFIVSKAEEKHLWKALDQALPDATRPDQP